jgi:hypothetical protein
LTGTNTIMIGLLNIATYGSGFHNLKFTVSEGSTTVLSDNFVNLAAAKTFFTDDPLSLGTITGNVAVTLSFQLTATKVMGAGISYALADAPGAIDAPADTSLAEMHEIAPRASEPAILESIHGSDLAAALERFNARYTAADYRMPISVVQWSRWERPAALMKELMRDRR